MNTYKKILRIWITISSFIGFLVGWVFISHTVDTKTVMYVGNTAVQMPAIPTLPALDGTTSNSGVGNVQSFTVTTSQQNFSPVFRTGGS